MMELDCSKQLGNSARPAEFADDFDGGADLTLDGLILMDNFEAARPQDLSTSHGLALAVSKLDRRKS